MTNDLVVGTFGRGFWVLDDYTPLRVADPQGMDDDEATLFPVRKAWMFFERTPWGLSGQGSNGHQFFIRENPPVAATFTYHLRDGLKTKKELRLADEKEIWQKDGNLEYPSWDALRGEDRENAPRIVLTVRDGQGNVVRRVDGPKGEGTHRVHWDFRYPSPEPTNLNPPAWSSPWSDAYSGALAMPGRYTVELAKVVDGEWTELAGPVEFEADVLAQATLAASSRAELTEFQTEAAELQRVVLGMSRSVRDAHSRIDHVRQALLDTPGDSVRDLLAQLDALEDDLQNLEIELNGDATVARRQEATRPGLSDRIGRVVYGYWATSAAPTKTMRDNAAIVAERLPQVLETLTDLVERRLSALESELEDRGGPWTPGRIPDWKGN